MCDIIRYYFADFVRGGFPRCRGGPAFRGMPPNYRFDEWTGEPDLPVISEEELRLVQRESETRTIDIDKVPREIRTYGLNAVVLYDSFVPKTMSFQDCHCQVILDAGERTETLINLCINEDYKDFIIAGEKHRIRSGVPTQEIFIDGRGYQCFFGGKPIAIDLAGRTRTVSLRGRPPQVQFGEVGPMNSFLLGRVYLTINGNTRRSIPLYLDAKPQRVSIDGKALIFKFVDKFTTLEINKVKFPVSFGGPPIVISVRQVRKVLFISSVPPYIIPGQTSVLGMEQDSLIPTYPILLGPKNPPHAPSNVRQPISVKPPPIPPNLPLFPAPPTLPPVTQVGTVAPSTTPLLSIPPPSLTSAPPSLTGAPPSLTGAPPSLTGAPPSLTGAPPSLTGAPPSLTSAPPSLTSAPPPVTATTSTIVVDNKAPDVRPGSYSSNELSQAAPEKPIKSAPLKNLDVSSLLETLVKVGIIGKPETEQPAAAAEAKDDIEVKKVPTKAKKKKEEAQKVPDVPLDEDDEDWIEKEEGGFVHQDRFYDIAKMDSLFEAKQLRK